MLYNGSTFDPFELVCLDEFLIRDLKVCKYLRPSYVGAVVLARALSRLGGNVEVDLGETCN
jgi:hypothetical protein